MQPEPTIFAYLAGVIDSDGYITSACTVYKGRRSVAASIGITGTNRAPHDLAASIFGGNINGYAVKGAQTGRRVNYMWQRYGRRAVPVIEAVLPYLRVKADQAHLALHLQELVNEAREMRTCDDPYPWFVPDYNPEPSLIAFAAEIRDLNTRSTRSRL